MNQAATHVPRVLTPALADRFGISPSRVRTELRRANWQRLASAVVFTRPDPPSRFDWAEAALVTSGPSAALSGWDAVVLHGLRTAAPEASAGLVLVRTGRSRRVGPVLVRRTDRPYDAHLTHFEHPLLPLAAIAAPARAVADAAIWAADLGTVRTLVARAVQRGACTIPDLLAELGDGPRNGSRYLRMALGEVAAGARSAAEAVTFERLRQSRLPDFEVNVPVVDARGRVVYEVDVLWRAYRAALEIDSREFHYERDDWQATMRRHNVLAGAALSVVHFPPSVLLGPDAGWLDDVERWLRARAAEIGVAYRPGSPRRPVVPHAPEPLRLPSARVA